MTRKLRSKASSSSPGAGVPWTATQIATPSAAPTCRSAVTVATPVASDGAGTSMSAEAVSAGRHSPTPMPVQTVPGR